MLVCVVNIKCSKVFRVKKKRPISILISQAQVQSACIVQSLSTRLCKKTKILLHFDAFLVFTFSIAKTDIGFWSY
jgi:hypothetical protein